MRPIRSTMSLGAHHPFLPVFAWAVLTHAGTVVTRRALSPKQELELRRNRQQYRRRLGLVGVDGRLLPVPTIDEDAHADKQLMQSDGIHPTAEAQPIILDNVWPELEPMLEETYQASSQ